jgi:hypothetical protein
MRTGVEGWLVILAVAGIAAYVILTRRLERRQFLAEGRIPAQGPDNADDGNVYWEICRLACVMPTTIAIRT